MPQGALESRILIDDSFVSGRRQLLEGPLFIYSSPHDINFRCPGPLLCQLPPAPFPLVLSLYYRFALCALPYARFAPPGLVNKP